jgi:hypothetical protein
MEQLIFIQFIQIYVYSVKSSTVIRTYILTCYINENRYIFNMEIRTYQSIYDFNKYSQICTKRSPLGQKNYLAWWFGVYKSEARNVTLHMLSSTWITYNMILYFIRMYINWARVYNTYTATCIKRSPFSCHIIEHFIWIEPL